MARLRGGIPRTSAAETSAVDARHATLSRIDDDYSDFDLNSASKPPENEDYVFPGRARAGAGRIRAMVRRRGRRVRRQQRLRQISGLGGLAHRDITKGPPRLHAQGAPPVPDEMLPEEELKAKLAATKKEKEMFQCQKFREAFCGSYVTNGERFVLEDGILTLKEKFEGSLDIKRTTTRARRRRTTAGAWRSTKSGMN